MVAVLSMPNGRKQMLLEPGCLSINLDDTIIEKQSRDYWTEPVGNKLAIILLMGNKLDMVSRDNDSQSYDNG